MKWKSLQTASALREHLKYLAIILKLFIKILMLTKPSTFGWKKKRHFELFVEAKGIASVDSLEVFHSSILHWWLYLTKTWLPIDLHKWFSFTTIYLLKLSHRMHKLLKHVSKAFCSLSKLQCPSCCKMRILSEKLEMSSSNVILYTQIIIH